MKVKKLKWQDSPKSKLLSFRTDYVISQNVFVIEFGDFKTVYYYIVYFLSDDKYGIEFNHTLIGIKDTLKKAKDFAQNHFNNLILNNIEIEN